MKKLIAAVSIQYKGKRYIPGEEIPADNAEMVEAWKRAGSVKELEKEAGLSEGKEKTLSGETKDPDKLPEGETTENPGKTSETDGKKKK